MMLRTMRVLVFDRIFDGHDVARIALIDLVDQRRQRRGFPGAGRAPNQHQPATEGGQTSDLNRKSQLVERRHLHRERADRGRGPTALAM
jgi:hypothetical protein